MTGYESKKAMARDKLDSMEREALKLALDLATMHHTDDGYAELRSKVRQFAKEALAQPAQEPVEALKLALEALEASAPWVELTNEAITNDRAIADIKEALAQLAQKPVAVLFGSLPVYDTTPPKRPWVGLTDAEFQLIYDMGRTPAGMMEMVEAKLKEKNNG